MGLFQFVQVCSGSAAVWFAFSGKTPWLESGLCCGRQTLPFPWVWQRVRWGLSGNNDSSHFSNTLQRLKVLSYPVFRSEGTLQLFVRASSAPLQAAPDSSPCGHFALFCDLFFLLKYSRHPEYIHVRYPTAIRQLHTAMVCHRMTPLQYH